MAAFETLLSPVILFFVLGALAAAARSDLSVPEPLAKSLSLYLMAAIGLKGGIQVAERGSRHRVEHPLRHVRGAWSEENSPRGVE